MEDPKYSQIHCALYIYDKLRSGGEYSTVDFQDMLRNEKNLIVSDRTLRRYINEIKLYIGSLKRIGNKYWKMERQLRKQGAKIRLNSEQLLSFHILKSHLRQYKNTVIEEGIIELEKLLDRFAPGNVFESEGIFRDKNIGQYDYTRDDIVLRRLLKFIPEKSWVLVEYKMAGRDKISKFRCYPRMMFEFKGGVYVVVYVSGKSAGHRALALHNIESVEKIEKRKADIPDFNFGEWSKERFGVFWGDTRKIKLLIKKKYKRYFENRTWHATQRLTTDAGGNMILTMNAPVVPDLVSWILSWHEAITVIEPQELKDNVIDALKKSLENY